MTTDEDRLKRESYFAQSLRNALDEADMSQQALADEMAKRGHKWHQATVYKVLREQRKVTLSEAHDIAAILGADLNLMMTPVAEQVVTRNMRLADKMIDDVRGATTAFLGHRSVVELVLDGGASLHPRTRARAIEWLDRPDLIDEAVSEGRIAWASAVAERGQAHFLEEDINSKVYWTKRTEED